MTLFVIRDESHSRSLIPMRGLDRVSFHQEWSLLAQLQAAFFELDVSPGEQNKIHGLMEELHDAHPEHYEHSIRVGLLAKEIGLFLGLDGKALLYAGLLHDIGKADLPQALIAKCSTWTPEDQREVQRHVILGYERLRGQFDFSAEILLLHHTFQPEAYPSELPPFLHDYSKGTREKIVECARIVALADCFDALHRVNCRHGTSRSLSISEIRAKMVELNPEREALIARLIKAGFF